MIKTAPMPFDQRQTASRLSDELTVPWLQWLGFTLMHVPLAFMMDRWPGIATIHAVFTLILGVWFLVRDQSPLRVLYVCGYIVGAEVLWRMTDAGVNWEYGKYTIAFLSLLAVLRWKGRLSTWPILYLLFMSPSVVIPFLELPWPLARRAVSFNLSASLALTLFLLFAGNVRLHISQFCSLLQALISPIVGIASLALRTLVTHSQIRFTNESNWLASGGYGPNQVSAILGLGALAGWIIFLLLSQHNRRLGAVYVVMMFWFVSHALLTFSRGGVVNFAAGVLVSLAYLGRKHFKLLLIAVVLLLAFLTIVFPILNQFTGGMLETRLRDLDPTGRDVYIRMDMELWKSNPLFGVGAGMAPLYRAGYLGIDVATHTEYTRLLAEHGLLGLGALAILAILLWRAYRQASSPLGPMLVLTFVAWCVVEMGHSATRIVAIPFCIGLALLSSRIAIVAPGESHPA